MHDAQVRDDTGAVVFTGSREHAESYAMSASQDGRDYDVYHRDNRRGRWYHRRTFCNGDAE